VPAGPRTVGTEAALEKALCMGRPGCAIETQTGLDKPGSNIEYLVATVRFAHDAVSDCLPRETWYAAINSSGGPPRVLQLLVESCVPDLAGTPQIEHGEPARIRYVQPAAPAATGYRGAADRYDLDIDRPALVRAQRGMSWDRTESWDWDFFAGWMCGPATDGSCPDPSLALPSVDLASDPFTASGWKATALDECALRFGAEPGGPPTGPTAPIPGTSATVRALLSQATLYVEIRDDRFFTNAAVNDRLEIELANGEALPDEIASWQLSMNGTLSGKTATGIPLSGGRAEMAQAGPSVRRFRLTGIWNDQYQFARLTYDDTDDGVTFRPFASAPHAGPIHPVNADDAICATSGDSLRVIRTQRPKDPARPLVIERW
jgi:hypothetical protein